VGLHRKVENSSSSISRVGNIASKKAIRSLHSTSSSVVDVEVAREEEGEIEAIQRARPSNCGKFLKLCSPNAARK